MDWTDFRGELSLMLDLGSKPILGGWKTSDSMLSGHSIRRLSALSSEREIRRASMVSLLLLWKDIPADNDCRTALVLMALRKETNVQRSTDRGEVRCQE